MFLGGYCFGFAFLIYCFRILYVNIMCFDEIHFDSFTYNFTQSSPTTFPSQFENIHTNNI